MQKKTVLVTGSGRGIGRAIALYFAKQGYNVIINGKENEDVLKDTEREILNHAPCLSFLGDVGDREIAKKIIETGIKHFGAIDIVVNNAGISYIGLLTDMSSEEWNKVLTSNLTSVFHCSSLVLPHMIQRQSGKIINISSVWGNIGASCEVAYSASKGGVNAFTKALAKEVAPSHIQVNAIACGAIQTEMNQFLSEEDKESLIEEIPANRMGTVEEVAEFVFQVSQSGEYLNGQIIQFDGAWI